MTKETEIKLLAALKDYEPVTNRWSQIFQGKMLEVRYFQHKESKVKVIVTFDPDTHVYAIWESVKWRTLTE